MKNSVLVVGAGPAGVSSAYFIKKLDRSNSFDVDLIDRLDLKKYDKYHDICGEAAGKTLIDELYPLKLKGIVKPVNKIREHWPGNITIDTKMEGVLLDRPKFFNSIIDEFQKIGGNYKQKNLIDFEQKNNKVKVKIGNETSYYDYVIAADGANSKIRKKLNVAGRTKAFVQYIVDKKPKEDILEFFYDAKYKGDYKWIFPHENKVKIGYPLISNKIFKPKEKIIAKQARTIGYGGIDKYVKGNILLVGDAACQTNPITKGGIRPAMIAGKIAASAVIQKNPSFYEKDWLKTDFSSDIFMQSFRILENMDNTALEKHMKPFKNIDTGRFSKKVFLDLKILFKYRNFLTLYKAYNLSNKVGW